MKKIALFISALFIFGLFAVAGASAYPNYSTRCSGCSATYYTHQPYSHYYYGSYTYGYTGWNWYKTHYHYRYPYYRHYYSYNWHYPYAYNYYPAPMYNTGHWGGYGPGIIW